ncbi:MAG: hypothetical protein FJX64_06150 [Alphaproteobacteria bacterium]|nr:hypothetical protein [Alphaproteobacteria bacterium]
MAHRRRDRRRIQRTRMAALAAAVILLSGCANMATGEGGTPPKGELLTQAGTDAPKEPASKQPDGHCLACFPEAARMFNMPFFGLR